MPMASSKKKQMSAMIFISSASETNAITALTIKRTTGMIRRMLAERTALSFIFFIMFLNSHYRLFFCFERRINSFTESIAIELAESVAQQDDLTLQAIIVDGYGKELEYGVDRDYHGERLSLDTEL